MNRHHIIEEARIYLKKELERDSSGHDWWHIVRVAGAAKRPMHNPELPPREHMTQAQYTNEQGTAINHFHEKLLKLKALMNTEAARALAEERHSFMNVFLERFYQEWYLGDDLSSWYSPSLQAAMPDWSGYRTMWFSDHPV